MRLNADYTFHHHPMSEIQFDYAASIKWQHKSFWLLFRYLIPIFNLETFLFLISNIVGRKGLAFIHFPNW